MKRWTNKMLNTFDELVQAFIDNGFQVKVTNEKDYRDESKIYRFCKFNGHKITGGFAEVNDGYSYSYLDGRISADNIKCFDKWSKCPLCVKFPVEEKRLFEGLRLLGSTKGYKISNSYDYYDSNPFPYDKFEVRNEIS